LDPRTVWDAAHRREHASAWIDEPTLFARWAQQFFPRTGILLDLGAGQGADSRFFAKQGYTVHSTDFSPEAVACNTQKSTAVANYTASTLDLREPLPYPDGHFDIVYAHLSLHYCTREETRSIFGEIRRVLKRGGVLALLVNSKHEPKYAHGTKLEEDYYVSADGIARRFFDTESLLEHTTGFSTIVCDEQGEKRRPHPVENLVRYVGTKD
jgi:SAM-dependent methyltransferase